LSMPEMIIASVVLLFVATLSSVIFKRFKIPYTIGLVLVGIIFYNICGAIPAFENFRHLRLNYDLIMFALLPSLIFSAAINIDSKLLFKNLNPTFLLAGPGLLISALVTSFIMYYFTPLDLAASLLFGALISATDPVAVISLFEIVGAPKRLRILVDGESLFNDATAIVVFVLLQKVVLAGSAFTIFTLGVAAGDFIFIFLGGFFVGALSGYIMAQILLFIKNDPMVSTALSAIVAYTAFIFAERVLEVSGVMACLGAGMVISHYSSSRFTAKTKAYLKNFWEFVSFIANSYIFILLGFTEKFYLFSEQVFNFSILKYIIWGIIAIQVSRAIIIFAICPLIGMRDKSKKIDWKYQVVMFWGGLRGAVPLALVFSLPENMPYHLLIVQITLGVVLFTLIVQGGTISKLLSLLKLDRASLYRRFSKNHALLLTYKHGMKKLMELALVWDFPKEVVEQLKNKYQKKINEQTIRLNDIVKNKDEEQNELRRTIWTQALRVESNSLRELFESGFIHENLFRDLDFCMDQQLEMIINGNELPPQNAYGSFQKNTIRKFLEKFKHWSFGRKYKAYLLNEEYLAYCTLAIGILAARKRLAELKKDDFFRDYLEGINICDDFYKGNMDKLLERVKAFRASNVKLLTTISLTTLQEMVYSNELTLIDELLENTEVSEEIHSELSALFHQKIKENGKQVYQKIMEI
ncbi:MAG: sodium:proton antiporter, partial [Victivallales bacterium]|nr:sodium:proton antiporter [Victivallales bacterium]